MMLVQSLGAPTEVQSTSTLLPRAAIARSFGSAAQHYDEHAALQRTVADNLFARLPSTQQNSTILDMGCGTGYCSQLLRKRFPQGTIVALDLALPMLQKARQHAATVQLVCADAASLPLQNGCLDLVVSSLTIQWCVDYAQFFAELQRVLAPGAHALLSSFGPATLQEVRCAWARVDEHTHVNSFTTAAELQLQAQQAGLSCTLESERLVEHHASLYTLSHALKGIGAHNMNRTQANGLTSPRMFRRAAGFFAAGAEDAASVPVTWEIYYLLLHKAA
jgi:malonyl-CoA O-methyltransferase